MSRQRTFFPLALCACVFFAVSPALAQQIRVLHDDAWCEREGWSYDSDGERYCEVREITLHADRDHLAVDGRQNGGIRVEGWNRNEILVRAKVTAHARTETTARNIAEDVAINTERTIYADVPDTRHREWASVSFEVFVPRRSNLSLETHNGGITIENVDGDVDFEALNGGVTLVALAGDVHGRTTNGGITLELTGDEWDGDGLDVRTTNGGVTINIPRDYSANLETSTVNGKLEVDFPITVMGRIDSRLSTRLGDGGRTIHVSTTNGGVRISRG